MRTAYNPSELEIKGYKAPLRKGDPQLPEFNRPITPRENLELLFNEKTPYWMPVLGMRGWDIHVFRPRMFPDNAATHLVYDAENPIQYDSMIQEGWFGLPWEYVPVAGGATVHPGEPKVPSMENWEEYITLPDVDALDWEGSAAINTEYLKTDNMRQIAFLSCLWERLISLMDVENAAIALIDEDEQEGVHRFFDQMCNIYDKMIEYAQKYYGIDMVLWHDDWGTQKSTFFSVETHREMILPYMKRIVDSCHKRGLYFELHSCGLNETLVPNMIEAGIDLWCGQNVNDFEKLAHTYKDSSIVFGIPCPSFTAEDSDEVKIQAARDIVERYKGCRIAISCLFGYPDEVFGNAIYEFSRREYMEESK
ncbi:MAG: uroporphyrinogen decarboxylase family protein [Lachnospiraceae bacterium]|nr:uroporphyrinogen decarboxylase family protein [Lachnospiraceae bacterium]